MLPTRIFGAILVASRSFGHHLLSSDGLTDWLAGLLGPVVDALLLDGTKGGAVVAWLLQLKKPISAPFSGAALFLSSR